MPTLAKEGMSRRYAIFRRGVNVLGNLLLGLVIEGEERVPKSGPLIIAANHGMALDPVFVCMAVPRRVQWMAKKELFLAPFRGALGLLGAFPVDRQGGGRGALRKALSYLSEGWALGIFPEGHRQRPGGRGEARSGAVMLAARSGAVIVPVYIGRVPSIRGRLRGERFRTCIGCPITLDESLKGGKSYKKVADEVLEGIYAFETPLGKGT